jgi:Holliday junction resolvase-like predicted endonuclease
MSCSVATSYRYTTTGYIILYYTTQAALGEIDISAYLYNRVTII